MSRKKIIAKTPPGLKLRHILHGQESGIYQISWSPDGQRLASASYSHTPRVWHTELGELPKVLKGHNHAVMCVAWCQDGHFLASGSYDKTAIIWDVETGTPHLILEGQDSIIFTVAWSPKGDTLASGAYNGTIWLWDVGSEDVIQILEGHKGKIRGLAWSPDGKVLASCSDDHTIRLWDVETGDELLALSEHTREVFGVAWSPNEWVIASTSVDKTVRLWDAKTGTQIQLLEDLEGHRWGEHVSFSPDGSIIAASTESAITFWRCDTWQKVSALHQPGPANKSAFAFNPKTSALAIVSEINDTANKIYILDLDLNAMLDAAPYSGGLKVFNISIGKEEGLKAESKKAEVYLPSEREVKVFISYNHQDSDVAHELKDKLEENNIDVVIDSESMIAGSDIKEFIEKSVNDTDVTLSIVSNNSLLSGWVAMETVDTFNHTMFKKDRKFIACYIDTDFFGRDFILKSIKKIDAEIKEIQDLMIKYDREKIDTSDLNSEKTRLFGLRNNLSNIIGKLRDSLCIDIRGDKLEENLPKIIDAISLSVE